MNHATNHPDADSASLHCLRFRVTLTGGNDVVQGWDGVGEIDEIVVLNTGVDTVHGMTGWGARFHDFVIERPLP